VIVEIDVRVVEPHRVMEPQRYLGQLIAKRCQRKQSRISDLAEQVEAESALDAGDSSTPIFNVCMWISRGAVEQPTDLPFLPGVCGRSQRTGGGAVRQLGLAQNCGVSQDISRAEGGLPETIG
jgi:hypothetical protein